MSLQLPRFVKKNSLDVERETFEKAQATTLAKAINVTENEVKEKHIRNAIIGTYQERGASTFWDCVVRISLKENPILCWKFCHVLHKVLREGHLNVVRDSQVYKPFLVEHGRFWGHLKTGGYGELVRLYCNLLTCKLQFHMKNPQFPGNLLVDEDLLKQSTADGCDALFSLAIDMFDYLDCILDLQSEIFKTVETSKYSSMTNAGQCRLKPLIPCIQDSTALIECVTKLMFRLHEKLLPDLLLGHRDRFLKIFRSLQKFYENTMRLQYFRNLIEIHHLPKSPPNFLIQSELQNYQPSRITVLQETMNEPNDATSEQLVSLDDVSSRNGSSSPLPDPGVMALYMEKDKQVKELEYAIEGHKLELDRTKLHARTQIQQLQFDISELKHELNVLGKQIAEKDEVIKNLNEHECKVPPEILKRLQDLENVEERTKNWEEKFNKLKELYTNLSQEHVALLRKHAPLVKELEENKRILNNQIELGSQLDELRKENSEREALLHEQLDEKEKSFSELTEAVNALKTELREMENQKHLLQSTLISEVEGKGKECHKLQEAVVKLKEQVQVLESSKATVERELNSALGAVKDELSLTKASKISLEETGSVIKGKLDDSELKILELTKRLDELSTSKDSLTKRVTNLTQQIESMLSGELNEANTRLDSTIIRNITKTERTLEDLDNPKIGPEPGLIDYFIVNSERFEDDIRSLWDAVRKDLNNPQALNQVVIEVEQLGQQVNFLLIYGEPLSRSGTDIQKGEDFMETLRKFGNSSVNFLKLLKSRNFDELVTSHDLFKGCWRKLLEKAKGIGASPSPEADVAEILDSELHAMELAIDEAAKKMEDILKTSRASHTGVKLEINEKLIDSCTTLMSAIRLLVQRSKALQYEIVAQGRGNASAKDFYKRNNQWTEGLISAAKAVGIGAKLLLESADKAVSSKAGGYEYLVASSQEIAASTIQLVVASQVRADRSSSNLSLVKQASSGVKTATANVVATAKDCSKLIEESADEIDVTKLSPHQSKRLELELQAELLRMESNLEKSRQKLSALRKHHYHNDEN